MVNGALTAAEKTAAVAPSRETRAVVEDVVAPTWSSAAWEGYVDAHGVSSADAFDGYIDLHAFSRSLGGWLYLGWVARSWVDGDGPAIAVARCRNGERVGELTAVFFDRADVRGRGIGCILLMPNSAALHEDAPPLVSLEIDIGAVRIRLKGDAQQPVQLERLIAAIKPERLAAFHSPRPKAPKSADIGSAAAAKATEAVSDNLIGFSDAHAVTTTPAATTRSSNRRHGHVDLYGYHAAANAWFFCGWVSGPWADNDMPKRVAARFEDGAAVGETSLAAFYYRDDIQGRGVGFVLALDSTEQERNHLASLDFEFADGPASLATTGASPGLSGRELVDWLSPLLTGGEANSNRSRLRSMLLPQNDDPDFGISYGYIDLYGYHSMAGGWLFCGWVSSTLDELTADGPLAAAVQFERGELRGEAARVQYDRDDLGERGRGLVLFVSGAGSALGGLLSITIGAGSFSFIIYPGTGVRRLREQVLLSGLRSIVAGAPSSGQRETMLAILRREGFIGTDTIGELTDHVFLEIDETISCGSGSLVLIGWFLAKPEVVRAIRLRCGVLASTVQFDEALRVDRPDVLAGIGKQHGFDDPRCGFIVFLERAVDGANIPYFEIETRCGEVGYRTLPPPKLEGIAATKRLLECFDVRFLDVPRAYDRVIGPAIELLTKNRLKAAPLVTALEFGAPPANPEFSVIIPLHGRIDFVEYQLALFSIYPRNSNYEFIYILDDPPKQREAQFLFTSIYERLRLSFRALLLDRNIGFAPTSNVGLRHANGKYVCFLNSDAFPGTPDWLERLAARLVAHPDLGAIGPLLLYEDGSIQHQGMSFRQLYEFGNWHFGHHPGKGLQPGKVGGLQKCISITGACILMERGLAEHTHGFDEAYAIGDFEDSDLCMRLHQIGLNCAVDLDTHLYHLERKSQGSAAHTWRMNLTLYNAWFHERRWAHAIAAHPYAYALGSRVDEMRPSR